MKNIKFLAVLLFIATALFTFVSCQDDSSSTPILPASSGGTTVTSSTIDGVEAPVVGAVPVENIKDNEQFTGTVSWNGSHWSDNFGGAKAYTATITLTPKMGYTMSGVAANFFKVAGVTSVTNAPGSGVVTAVFPATDGVSVGESCGGGKVGYVFAEKDGEQHGLIVANNNMGTVGWVRSGNAKVVVGNTLTALASGSDNTTNIIEKVVAGGGTVEFYAAERAKACTDGGYSDWFLPSYEELNLSKGNFNTLGIAEAIYWSSSEDYGFTGSDGMPRVWTYQHNVKMLSQDRASGVLNKHIVRPFRSF
jgi:hypothetical protein